MSVLPGCSEKKQSAETAASSKADAQKVVIKGSNTIGEELGPRLIAEYRKDHPAAAFELESKGTGSGLWALVANQCDLAAASRAINAEELKQANERGMKLDEHTIGSYSVAVVVHADNPVKDLTKDQVRDLFIDVVQNWKDVGGPDAPVHFDIRAWSPTSGSRVDDWENDQRADRRKGFEWHLSSCRDLPGIDPFHDCDAAFSAALRARAWGGGCT